MEVEVNDPLWRQLMGAAGGREKKKKKKRFVMLWPKSQEFSGFLSLSLPENNLSITFIRTEG